MLACAACAREKQHLLVQLLKETKEINLSQNAMPNTGCSFFVRMGFKLLIPLTLTDDILNFYKDVKFFEE